MKLKEALSSISTKAIQFLRDDFPAEDRRDHLKLMRLLDDHVFESKGFADVSLDVAGFDWQEEGHDKNWWWQLQPLHFLSWYSNSFGLLSAEDRTRYYALCRDAVLWWLTQASANENSPLAWHDHATAFRLKNIVNWVIFCHINDLGIADDPAAEPLAGLIFDHFDWLQDDANYSIHTNHGFDQAMMALMAALMFSSERFDPYRSVNRNRLKAELGFAFTDQGVHKENSAGYQKSMLNRIRQIEPLKSLGEHELSGIAQSYIQSATNFLEAITLPDGSLPLIGDTRGGDIGLTYRQKDQIDVLEYSASGYVIIRGKIFDRDFHLLFKNGHLSHYHRHDDDLSLHLYFDGTVLLGDGGLGSHNETDPDRILIRSGLAHNAPYIVGREPVRTLPRLNGFFPKTVLADGKIYGESFCHGVTIRRELDFSCISEGKILLKDTALNEKSIRLASNFYATSGFEVDGDAIYSKAQSDYTLRIRAAGSFSFRPQKSIFSSKFGQFSPVTAISVLGESLADRNTIETTLDLVSAHLDR